MIEKNHRKYISWAQTHFWASWKPKPQSKKGLCPPGACESKVSDLQSRREDESEQLFVLPSDLLAPTGKQTETRVADVEMFLNIKNI